MGFFFDDPKKVTAEEFKKVRQQLYGLGFSTVELDDVEMAFRGDVDADDSRQGIVPGDIVSGIRWLRDHPKSHRLTPDKLDQLQKALMEKL